MVIMVDNIHKQPLELFYRNSVTKNFEKLTGKQLCRTFFNEVEGLRQMVVSEDCNNLSNSKFSWDTSWYKIVSGGLQTTLLQYLFCNIIALINVNNLWLLHISYTISQLVITMQFECGKFGECSTFYGLRAIVLTCLRGSWVFCGSEIFPIGIS